MSITLSDDLRQALESAGTPLRLVDPVTGETYVVVAESAYAALESTAESDEELRAAQIPTHRLREIAERSPPPQAWFESDEEKLFE